MDFLKRTFGSKRSDEGVQQADAKPLRIGGTKPVALTPEPDDAELAVQALLEIMTRDDFRGTRNEERGARPEDACYRRDARTRKAVIKREQSDACIGYAEREQTRCETSTRKEERGTRTLATGGTQERGRKNEERTAEYYRMLADRMRRAHDQATMRAMRFLAWCEQELPKHDLPLEGKGSLQQMEVELYKRIDTVERAGGELKRRWQHCLAEVIVRQMTARDTAGGDE